MALFRVPSRRCGVPATLALTLLAGACGGAGSSGADEPHQSTSTRPTSAASDGRLLYSSFDESTHTFLTTYVARADGSGATELPLPGPEGGGRWSHAGDEIAVMTLTTDGRVGTAVIDADGTVLRTLTLPGDSLNLVCTVWSPDDRRLACEGFDESRPDATGVYTVRASDGRDVRRLTAPPAGQHDLPGDWTPDGRSVLFLRRHEEDDGAQMLVRATGTGEEEAFGDASVEDPGRFSPDGTNVLTSAGGELLVLDRAGNEVGRISRSGHYLFGAVWSPDGSRLAYSDATGGPFADIYTALPDGSERAAVTSTPENEIRVEWGATP